MKKHQKRKTFAVKVRYEQIRDIRVHANDEQEAKERAVELVSDWGGVVSAEAEDAHEVTL